MKASILLNAVTLAAGLVAAASAHAECAWVLWTKDPALSVGADKTKPPDWSFTALGPEIFGSYTECMTALAKYRANRTRAYGKFRDVLSPLGYACLPDTVDPRWPKR